MIDYPASATLDPASSEAFGRGDKLKLRARQRAIAGLAALVLGMSSARRTASPTSRPIWRRWRGHP